MKYKCLDCGYKGNQLLQGKCPACQSSSMSNLLNASPQERQKEAQPIRIMLLIALWSLLIYKAFTLIIT